MKKVNIQRNQLKCLLILNDFYDILCYFRQPFFKFGNKTAQQITNLPIFLSFFIMFLSILQISFDTKNSSILKNYPLLVNLTNKKIPQKFETLYLQLDKIQATGPKGDERLLNDKPLWIFPLKTNKPEYPTIFHQIQNLKQKQNTINLYKTFEQMGPLLLSEIQKEEDLALLGCKEDQEDIIHLGVDIPYQSWSSNTKNFNVTEDKLLTNWRFNDSELIIKDFKKGDSTDNVSNIIQEFIVQYENYVKEIKNTKYISLKNLPFQKIQITQNADKIFIQGPFRKAVFQPNETQAFFDQKSFLNDQTFKKGESTPPKDLSDNPASQRPALGVVGAPLGQRGPNGPKNEASLKNPRLAAINQNKGPDLSEKRLKKKIFQFQKGLLSRKFQKEIIYLSNKKSQLSQILKEALFVRLPVRTHIEDPLKFTKRTQTGLANRTPPTIPSKYMENLTEDIVYQIQEIEDQIPMKIQGSQGVFAVRFSTGQSVSSSVPSVLPRPLFWEDGGFLEAILPFSSADPGGSLTLADNRRDPIYLFDENPYQEREYEVITYDKKVWDTLHKKLSHLHVQRPPFMEFVRQNQENIDKAGLQSLLNIKFISQGYHGLSEGVNLLKFLEFTQKKILKHSHFFRKLEKCQFKQLKDRGQFDLEIQETENPKNFETQNICYNFKIGFLSQNQKDRVFSPSSFEPANSESFVENIWFLPKPRKVQWNNAFFGVSSGEARLKIGSQEQHPKRALSLKNWNQKIIQRTGRADSPRPEGTLPSWGADQQNRRTTFDNYIKKSSHLLQLQEENPYLLFDQIITPEDYLLETLFFFIKQNLTKFKEIDQQKEQRVPPISSEHLFGASDESALSVEPPAVSPTGLSSADLFEAREIDQPQNFKNNGSNGRKEGIRPFEPVTLETLPCPSDPRQQSSSFINEKKPIGKRLGPNWADRSNAINDKHFKDLELFK